MNDMHTNLPDNGELGAPMDVPAEPIEVDSRRRRAVFWTRKQLNKPSAPLVVGALVLAVGAVAYAAYSGVRIPLVGKPAIVVFDPVKFLNAQRATAALLAVNPSAELSLTMTQVAKQAEQVIEEEADGAVVLVKQSVVGNQLPDITDKVLKRFGLPTDVPSVSIKPTMDLGELAPTNSAFGAGQLREDYREELKAKAEKLSEQAKRTGQQIDMVP